MAVQKWRPNLLGQHFVVTSYQHSLKYLWSQKISTAAKHKWLYKLMWFDFPFIMVDALLRMDHEKGEKEKSSHKKILPLTGIKEKHDRMLMALSSPIYFELGRSYEG
jgi:hypothetical protein